MKPDYYLTASAMGVLSHLCYFRKGEHHLESMRYLVITILFPLIASFYIYAFGRGELESICALVSLEIVYLCSLWTSMLMYRVSWFHRLDKFLGPLLWRLSKATEAWNNRSYRGFEVLHRLHQRYGNYVRTGPSELSVTDPDGITAILGSKSPCTRSAWTDMGYPLRSIFETRDRSEHDKRRRAWDRGFSIKALDGYSFPITSHSLELERQIAASNGKPLDVSQWFNYFSFDVMGDLAFGQSFDMLQSGEKHFLLPLLERGTKALGLIGSLPWLFTILTKVPGISADYWVFLRWCESQMLHRKKVIPDRPDIFSWLLKAEPMSSDKAKNHQWLVGDTRIAVVAGSHTTAAALTHCFYHLAADSSHAQRIRKEVNAIFDKDGKLKASTLREEAAYLNAFITETMRLHPSNPSGVFRQTPTEGLRIGKRHIPGDVTVRIPFWTIMRSPECYVRPHEFLPQRWTTESELVLRRDSYLAFSLGTYGCVGKHLALMEIREVIARLVTRFDIKFAPDETGFDLLEKSEDYFTLGVAKLMLQFQRRDG